MLPEGNVQPFNSQDDWLTRPAKPEPVSLSATATTALDWANTQRYIAFWEWTAEWQCVCQRDQNSADGGENFCIPLHPLPSISRPEPKTLTDWHTSRDQRCTYSNASESSSSSVGEGFGTESEGLEMTETWQMMDGYTGCPPCIIAIKAEANSLWPILSVSFCSIPLYCAFQRTCFHRSGFFFLFSTVLYFE